MPTLAEMDFNKRLALEVQKYPCLYSSNQLKGNRDRRAIAWQKVKNAMNEPEMTVEEYEPKWKSLKNTFRASIFQKEAKKLHYAFAEMTFMLPHYRIGTRNSEFNPLVQHIIQLESSSHHDSSQAGPSSSTNKEDTRRDGSNSSLRQNLGKQNVNYEGLFESMKERMAPMSESKKKALLNITDATIKSFEGLDAHSHQVDGNPSFS